MRVLLDGLDQLEVVLVVGSGPFVLLLSALRPSTVVVPTHSLDIVQIYDNLVALAVGDLLQLVHVFDLGLSIARSCAAGGWVVRVVDHVVLLLFALAIEIQPLQLVGGFGGGRLEGLEEVDEGTYAPLAVVSVCRSLFTRLPAHRS
jgi:hypothetical protein